MNAMFYHNSELIISLLDVEAGDYKIMFLIYVCSAMN